ncbi:MAG: FAD binding domain-containing protein, partial [Planctomycetes bacterium]|nr:FAD binding domain-containing protein [Planctomycetota bacterium]
EAVKLKHEFGKDAMIVAGGTDVVPKMKRRQFNPKYLIFLRKLKELRGISKAKNHIRIGSAERLSDVARNQLVRKLFPAVCGAIDGIATVVIQNMGTVGGNLLLDTRCNYYDQNFFWRKSIEFCLKKDGCTCWVAPSSDKCLAVASSDLTPVLIALRSKVRLVSLKGERTVFLESVYNNDGANYLNIDKAEILSDIFVPTVETTCLYKKLRRRGAFDFPVLGIACSAMVNSGVRNLRFVLTGCGSKPVVVDFNERFKCFDQKAITAIQDKLYTAGKPMDNTDLNMTWRKHMIKIITKELLIKISNT